MSRQQKSKLQKLSGCDSSNTTEIKVKKFVYTWMINNFDVFSSDTDRSPMFKVDNTYYKLELSLSSFSDYFNLIIKRVVSDNLKDTLSSKKHFPPMLLEICLLNNEGEEAITKWELFNEPLARDASKTIRLIEKNHFFGVKNRLLKNGVLTIVCNMYLYGDTERHPDQNKSDPKEIPVQRRLVHLDNYEPLLIDDKFSDFKLIVADQEFPVHKCILASQSQYFAAMFEHGTIESTDNKVEITDVKPEVMQEMLRFIYIGSVNDIEKLAAELLVAADKYLLDGLVTACEEALIDNLSIENIFEVLEHFDKCNSKYLREAAIKFATENSKTLEKSDKYRNLFKSIPWSFIMSLSRDFAKKL